MSVYIYTTYTVLGFIVYTWNWMGMCLCTDPRDVKKSTVPWPMLMLACSSGTSMIIRLIYTLY